MTHKEQIRSVREMLERHWTIAEIAHKLCISEALVLAARDSLRASA